MSEGESKSVSETASVEEIARKAYNEFCMKACRIIHLEDIIRRACASAIAAVTKENLNELISVLRKYQARYHGSAHARKLWKRGEAILNTFRETFIDADGQAAPKALEAGYLIKMLGVQAEEAAEDGTLRVGKYNDFRSRNNFSSATGERGARSPSHIEPRELANARRRSG